MKTTNTASIIITITAIIVGLVFGKKLIIPLIFAFIIWFEVREIIKVLNKIKFVRTKFPAWLKSVIGTLIIFGLLVGIGKLLASNINSLILSFKDYEINFILMTNKMDRIFDIDSVQMLKDIAGDIDIQAVLKSFFKSFTGLLGSLFLVLIYLLFIFFEEPFFKQKMDALFPENGKLSKLNENTKAIEVSISHYLGIKTLTSSLTGIFSCIVLIIIGVDSPVFWAFVIFLLNFIPNIGSLIATLFPAIFSLIQFGEIAPFFTVLIFVGIVQIGIGNILEPKLMGDSLNISPLVIIISLAFWGSIWGIIGMVLCVPITVIMIMIFSKFPKTRPFSIMLSKNGSVGNNN